MKMKSFTYEDYTGDCLDIHLMENGGLNVFANPKDRRVNSVLICMDKENVLRLRSFLNNLFPADTRRNRAGL